MKSLILLFVSLFIFSGCSGCSTSDQSNFIIQEFSYKGHSYIEFKPVYGYGSTVIHSPDCICYDK